MTAEEIIKEDESGVYNEVDIAQMMIKFTKFHVQEAIKQIAEKYGDQIGGREGWGKELIEQVYPLTNIK